ncbi:hypothetical protein GGS20DRAFT_538737 [Poronia punctata]|nr:hypothetical protein GGS20DRAFT_538737 [Poronia punctata]
MMLSLPRIHDEYKALSEFAMMTANYTSSLPSGSSYSHADADVDTVPYADHSLRSPDHGPYTESPGSYGAVSQVGSPHENFQSNQDAEEGAIGSPDTDADTRPRANGDVPRRKRDDANPELRERRRAQNRDSQRAYRMRKDQRIKDLEEECRRREDRYAQLERAYNELAEEYQRLKSPGQEFWPTEPAVPWDNVSINLNHQAGYSQLLHRHQLQSPPHQQQLQPEHQLPPQRIQAPPHYQPHPYSNQIHSPPLPSQLTQHQTRHPHIPQTHQPSQQYQHHQRHPHRPQQPSPPLVQEHASDLQEQPLPEDLMEALSSSYLFTDQSRE